MGRKILQPDGTYCYTGTTCKKHAIYNQTQTLRNQNNLLLTKPTTWREPTKNLYTHIPKKYYIENLHKTQKILTKIGLTKTLTLPEWNQNAINENLSELQINKNISLLITTPTVSSTGRARVTVWLTEKGKTISVLTFLTPLNKKAEKYWGKPVIASIQVTKTQQNKGYGSKTIKIVEQQLIKQKLHSNGQYTPAGAKAFKNKLPYLNPTNQNNLPLLEPMNFVENWENFWTK